jgi:hypothetical protein
MIVGGWEMHGKSLGIILSRREWNRITQKESINDDDSIIFEYAKRGEQLNIVVIFINIDEINISQLVGNAFIIEGNRIIEVGFVEIPSIVYNAPRNNRKKYNRTLTNLAQKPDVHVIKEQNNIKNKILFDLLKSQPELKKHIEKDENQIEPQILFYVLGQKNIDNQWEITEFCAKDSSGTFYTFEEAFQIPFVSM